MAIVDLFFEAVERNDVEGVRALLKKRRYLLSILKNDGSNCNAFHIAAKRGHVEMMNLLLVSLPDEKHHFSQGRLPHNRPDLSYHTPLSYAARYGHAVIVGQLRHAGAVYKVFNQNSPLGLAAQYGHVDIVRQLLVALEPGNFFIDDGRSKTRPEIVSDVSQRSSGR